MARVRVSSAAVVTLLPCFPHIWVQSVVYVSMVPSSPEQKHWRNAMDFSRVREKHHISQEKGKVVMIHDVELLWHAMQVSKDKKPLFSSHAFRVMEQKTAQALKKFRAQGTHNKKDTTDWCRESIDRWHIREFCPSNHFLLWMNANHSRGRRENVTEKWGRNRCQKYLACRANKKKRRPPIT